MHILALLKGWVFFVCFELVLFFLSGLLKRKVGKPQRQKQQKERNKIWCILIERKIKQIQNLINCQVFRCWFLSCAEVSFSFFSKAVDIIQFQKPALNPEYFLYGNSEYCYCPGLNITIISAVKWNSYWSQ